MSKKILVFSPYYPPHLGGLENCADELNLYLTKNGFEVTVLTPKLPNDSLEKEIAHAKVKIWRYPAWEIISNYPIPCFWNKKCREIYRNVLSGKYDWVFSHTRFFLTSFWAGLYAKKENIRWLHIEHGSDFVKLNSHFKSFLAKLFDWTLGRWILMSANKVVTVSLASAEFCKQLFSNRKYEVIYRGVELGNFENNLEIERKYKGKTKILFVGRLIDGKGVSNLIKAVEKLKELDWVLLIVGDGPQSENLKEEVKRFGIGDRVVFLGQIERQKLIGIMNIVDIVVNPSYTEGLPTVIVEAAKCAKAIVATDVGGTREIIENNKSGILIKPKETQMLSEKIELLMKNSDLRKKLGKVAKEETKNKFDWEVSVKDYINILE